MECVYFCRHTGARRKTIVRPLDSIKTSFLAHLALIWCNSLLEKSQNSVSNAVKTKKTRWRRQNILEPFWKCVGDVWERILKFRPLSKATELRDTLDSPSNMSGGADPVIKLLDEDDDVIETLAIQKWNTDSVEEFLDAYLDESAKLAP
ncbi:uncharacterized protein [Lepeophtheirus salmonis]|uniref:uncharacterized protein n=1 Tax=Lepeophtheirus salmonis TaxID=72036 RepID=UPI003AF3B812